MVCGVLDVFPPHPTVDTCTLPWNITRPTWPVYGRSYCQCILLTFIACAVGVWGGGAVAGGIWRRALIIGVIAETWFTGSCGNMYAANMYERRGKMKLTSADDPCNSTVLCLCSDRTIRDVHFSSIASNIYAWTGSVPTASTSISSCDEMIKLTCYLAFSCALPCAPIYGSFSSRQTISAIMWVHW